MALIESYRSLVSWIGGNSAGSPQSTWPPLLLLLTPGRHPAAIMEVDTPLLVFLGIRNIVFQEAIVHFRDC